MHMICSRKNKLVPMSGAGRTAQNASISVLRGGRASIWVVSRPAGKSAGAYGRLAMACATCLRLVMRHFAPFPTSEARRCCCAAACGLRRALCITAIRLCASCFLTSRKEIFFTVNSYINGHVMTNIHQRQRPSADEISAVFIPPAPAPLVAPRNIVPAGEGKELLREVLRLPSLSC